LAESQIVDPLEFCMAETRNAPAARNAGGNDSRYQSLRDLGARAHQLRATTRAADRFMAGHEAEDRDTGTWLISGAVELAHELAGELDGLARTLKDGPTEPQLAGRVMALRKRAHELHAACRAADRYLEDEGSEERETGSWLIASARGLADKLASEIDDSASALKRPGSGSVAEPVEMGVARRVA